jgi:alkylation response protein AidB-like acyl-CoA dehydrogenase
MNIEYSDAQLQYRNGFRKWLDENIPRGWGGAVLIGSKDPDENARRQIQWEKKLYAAGYQGITWPKEYGGQGLSMVEQLVVSEELGRRAVPEDINAIGKEFVGPIILAAGSEEQKRYFIPRILTLSDIWCQGFSEPDGGSDLTDVRTRAVRDGNCWVINGQKVWTNFAFRANRCILLARTSISTPTANHRGLTLFLVDMVSPGISVRSLVRSTGFQSLSEASFHNVRIPASSHIGAFDNGWNVMASLFDHERVPAQLYRQARLTNELEELLSHLRRRHDIRANDYYRQQIGRLYAELSILRELNLKMVSQIVNGDGSAISISVIESFGSDLLQKIQDFAFEVLGPGYVSDTTDIERFRGGFLQSRADAIYAAPALVQRNIKAERKSRSRASGGLSRASS